ncbi:MAG: hypothetical protein A3C12_01870 [Candidatus Sungbacteria bacterium RIFCSPHIGHO2_02_FULL_49_20]|uniref:Uncharacterized protein n=1 Tax=Candidatus Sungbacteria bacterium RIFCSPHIGHO2_02_FULL_49_20 TaxID=1802272 RepID=A0A1G2KST2_9BACT|nr:MAG: hypothetical protein A3C12_01870 [Candidatus Sungbacteria bacterium RIFCSPHIGHO2_02_FULL_49_20]
MKKYREELAANQMQVSLSDFLESYNKNMPADFPRASVALLNKFKDTHSTLFRHGDLWSVDLHRKRLIDWMPRYGDAS